MWLVFLLIMTACKIECSNYKEPAREVLVLPVRVEVESKATQINESCELENERLKNESQYWYEKYIHLTCDSEVD